MSRSSYLTAAELALFAGGVIAGLSGETLLFMRNQTRAIESALRDDFRVLLFLKADLPEGKLRILEEKVRALPSVEELKYVSPTEALESLRREDPDLVESVALLGENPLAPAFEVRLAAVALSRVPRWAEECYSLDEIGDVRYAPEQVRAILQARFCGHCLGFVLHAVLCLGGLLFAACLWILFPLRLSPAALGGAVLASTGTGVGMALTYSLFHPMRLFSAWWAWPGTLSQTLLVAAGAAAGAVASGWKEGR